MKSPTLAALTLSLSTVLAHSNPMLSPLHRSRLPGYTLRCETTLASPSTVHVRFTSDKLLSAVPSDLCTQYNLGGSRCTQVVSGATAAVAICAGFAVALQCRMVGQMVAELCEMCSFGFPDRIARTGGQIMWHGGGSRIVVYHT